MVVCAKFRVSDSSRLNADGLKATRHEAYELSAMPMILRHLCVGPREAYEHVCILVLLTLP